MGPMDVMAGLMLMDIAKIAKIIRAEFCLLILLGIYSFLSFCKTINLKIGFRYV